MDSVTIPVVPFVETGGETVGGDAEVTTLVVITGVGVGAVVGCTVLRGLVPRVETTGVVTFSVN